MASAAISRSIIIVFGLLYPAYCSYKAIKTRNVSEYVKWMMYWIVFALFYNVETIADLVISWFPMYYEMKAIFVIWLLSPATQGSDVIYKMYIHPRLLKHEQEIEQTLERMKSQSYTTLLNVGAQGVNLALQGAIAGQTKLADQIRKSYSADEMDSASNQEPQLPSVELQPPEDHLRQQFYDECNRIPSRFEGSAHNTKHSKDRHGPAKTLSHSYHEKTNPHTSRYASTHYKRADSPEDDNRQYMSKHMATQEDNSHQTKSINTRKRQPLRNSQSSPGLSQTRRRTEKNNPQQNTSPTSKAAIARPVYRRLTAQPSTSVQSPKLNKPSVSNNETDNSTATKSSKPRFTESTLRYRTKKISDIKSHKLESPFISML